MRARVPAAFGAALLATALVAPLAGCGQSEAPPAAAPSKSPDLISYAPGSAELDSVQIVTASTSPLPISADMNARLALDESQTSRVGAPVAGRVTQVLADIGQAVKAGQALAYLDAPDLGQARADLLTAQAESTRKAREMARSHMLFDGGAISRRDLEGAQADAAGAGAELERARLRLRNLGGGGGDALALTSSVSGYVIDRQINPGQQVGAGQSPLYTVSNPRALWLFLDVPEASSSRARIGEAVEFDVPAWPGRRFTAKITQIGLAVDPATRRVQVRALVDNPDLALKPEMYARARLVTDDGRRAVKVPNAAIFESGMRNYVFRVEAPGRFRRVPVEVGERGDSFSYLTSGIRNGERIVGEGALLLNAQLSGADPMLERLARFVVEKRIFVIVMVIALIIVGGRAVMSLPIEAFPDVQDVQVVVVSQQAGQAPEEMERSISLPIERALAGTPGVNDIRSVSLTGLSVVTLIFNDGTDDYFARSQVLEKLRDAELPAGVTPSLAPLSTAVGEVYRYVLDKPADMPLYEARAIQDFVVRPTLRMVPGVADVTSFGGSIKQYQILVRPDLLKRYGVTVADVQAAVGKANSNVGGGVIPRGDEVVVVRGVGLYKSIDDVGNTVVRAQNGNTVRVRDLGDVQIGVPERSGMVAYDHQDDVSEGIVTMVKRQNAAVVVQGVRDAVDKMNAQFRADAKRTGKPPIQIHPTYQRTKLLDKTVETVAENLVVGATLVTVLLLVFLRNWRAALVVAAIIPLALLAAFAGLNTVSVPANLISMGAVDFGIIIDSAVVLVEALMVALSLEAARHGGIQPDRIRRNQVLRNTVTNLARPILFSKAIIIMAFVPIFTFQRVEGKMFSPVALTLSFALGAALVLTLSFLPAVLSFLVERYDMAEKHIVWMDRLRDGYRNTVEKALPRTKAVFVASGLALVLAFLMIPRLGSEFLPKLDEGNIWLTIQLTPSASMETTRRVEKRVRQIMLSYPEVAHVGSETGRPDDGTDPKGPSSMQMLIDLKPRSEWRSKFGSKAALEDDMRKQVDKIPGVPTNFSQVIEDSVEESLSGVKGEISVKITGPDLNVLEELGQQTARVVAAVPGASDVDAVKIGGQTEVRAVLDRDAMARYGLNADDANTAIATAFGGATVGTAYEADRNFDIVVRFAPDQRNAVDDLSQLQVPLPQGGTISLGEIAHVSVQVGASRISRENGSRNVAIKANVDGRDQGSFVVDAQKAVKDKIKLPSGYQMTWGGQFENQQRAMQRLEVIVPIALFGIFILLFGAFRSVRSALLILAMVPFTTVGGVTALALAGLHMSVSAAVGFIAVAGISVQNGVVLLEHITHRYENGDAYRVAVLEGAIDRLRPILMTALMAGLGLLPAALSTGIGSETQRPFACVIVGGIISATAFMLLLLPMSLLWLSEDNKTQADV